MFPYYSEKSQEFLFFFHPIILSITSPCDTWPCTTVISSDLLPGSCSWWVVKVHTFELLLWFKPFFPVWCMRCTAHQMHFSWTVSCWKAGLHKSKRSFLLIRMYASRCCLMISVFESAHSYWNNMQNLRVISCSQSWAYRCTMLSAQTPSHFHIWCSWRYPRAVFAVILSRPCKPTLQPSLGMSAYHYSLCSWDETLNEDSSTQSFISDRRLVSAVLTGWGRGGCTSFCWCGWRLCVWHRQRHRPGHRWWRRRWQHWGGKEWVVHFALATPVGLWGREQNKHAEGKEETHTDH